MTGLSIKAIIIMAVMAHPGCGPVELDDIRQETDTEEDSGGNGEVPVVPKDRFITGVEYPEGYDWISDIGTDAEGAVLFLMKGDERIVELPVGHDSCVSADADMHRCLDGHLYTDFSTDRETVIKMDGIELLRYTGREMITGIMVRSDGIYTLGQPRSGTGWAFRKDGAIIISRNSGTLLHGLFTDEDSVCFSYQDKVETPYGTREVYCLVKDGTQLSIPAEMDVTGIDDAISVNGTFCYIAQLKGVRGRFLVNGSVRTPLEMPGDATDISGCRFITGDSGIFLTGTLKGIPGKGPRDAVWHGTGLLAGTPANGRIERCVIDGGKCYYIGRMQSETGTSFLYMNGKDMATPSRYRLIYPQCMGVYADDWCIALSDWASSECPVLWTEEGMTDYGFNGLFTSVTYW